MSVLTEGTLEYYLSHPYCKYSVLNDKGTFIQVPSQNLSASFIVWEPTPTSICLSKDSAESLRKTKTKYLVDLSITVNEKNLISFKRQSIFETFCFPNTSKPNSIMRITCKVYEEKLHESSTLEKRCLSDFARMLTDEKLADVTLLCQGGSLKAHKNILVARSKVFHTMFHSNMVEAKKNEVECKFDVSTMKALLEFMYFGKLDHSNVKELKDIFKAADYYGILQLKDACFEILTGDMSKVALHNLLLM